MVSANARHIFTLVRKGSRRIFDFARVQDELGAVHDTGELRRPRRPKRLFIPSLRYRGVFRVVHTELSDSNTSATIHSLTRLVIDSVAERPCIDQPKARRFRNESRAGRL